MLALVYIYVYENLMLEYGYERSDLNMLRDSMLVSGGAACNPHRYQYLHLLGQHPDNHMHMADHPHGFRESAESEVRIKYAGFHPKGLGVLVFMICLRSAKRGTYTKPFSNFDQTSRSICRE